MPTLTATQANRLIRDGVTGRHGDGEGLALVIDRVGRSYWILRIMIDGKSIERSLGPAADIRLSDARTKARAMREELKQGTNAKRAVPTFAELAHKHHAEIEPTFENYKHARQWITSLGAYAFPTLGDMPVDQITGAEVREVLLPIWNTKRETTRRVRQRIRAVLDVAKASGHRTELIDWDALNRTLPKGRRQVQHMPALASAVVPRFYSDLALSSSAPAVRAGLSFLILTACRPAMMLNAAVGQFDLERGVWTVPAGLMKMRQAYQSPIGPEAVAIVKRMIAMGSKGIIFTGRDGVLPMSADAPRMAMRRMGETATPHGFRSSFKDWARAQGYEDWLSELQLAHADKDDVRAAYARSDQLELRRGMMLDWERFVTGKRD